MQYDTMPKTKIDCNNSCIYYLTINGVVYYVASTQNLRNKNVNIEKSQSINQFITKIGGWETVRMDLREKVSRNDGYYEQKNRYG